MSVRNATQKIAFPTVTVSLLASLQRTSQNTLPPWKVAFFHSQKDGFYSLCLDAHQPSFSLGLYFSNTSLTWATVTAYVWPSEISHVQSALFLRGKKGIPLFRIHVIFPGDRPGAAGHHCEQEVCVYCLTYGFLKHDSHKQTAEFTQKGVQRRTRYQHQKRCITAFPWIPNWGERWALIPCCSISLLPVAASTIFTGLSSLQNQWQNIK